MAHDDPTRGPGWERARREFVEAQTRLEGASDRLAEVARRSREAAEAGKAHIASGGSATDIPAVAGLAQLRADINQAFEGFDHARLQTRLWTMVLTAAEGESLSSIARQWGVSRQYVSKLLKEHPEFDIAVVEAP